jgi:hypothetical protein
MKVDVSVGEAIRLVKEKIGVDFDTSSFGLFEVQNNRVLRELTNMDDTMANIMDDWIISDVYKFEYKFVYKSKDVPSQQPTQIPSNAQPSDATRQESTTSTTKSIPNILRIQVDSEHIAHVTTKSDSTVLDFLKYVHEKLGLDLDTSDFALFQEDIQGNQGTNNFLLVTLINYIYIIDSI